MDLLQIVALSALQGLTEFLPISSSAHLILLPQLEGWADQGLAFDVAVHVGSLSAVAWYFRRQLTQMARDWIQSLMTRKTVGESRLAWAVLFATIPVGLSGLVFEASPGPPSASPCSCGGLMPGGEAGATNPGSGGRKSFHRGRAGLGADSGHVPLRRYDDRRPDAGTFSFGGSAVLLSYFDSGDHARRRTSTA